MSTFNLKNKQFNIWDLIILVLAFSILAALCWAAEQMSLPYQLGKTLPIDLNPWVLPFYGLRTITRMFIALAFSLIFSLLIGLLAAKYRKLENFILSSIDILQSIPILGIQSMTLVGFISLFENSLLGPECAAIFAIFTSQVWNMALSFYQSIKTLPEPWRDVAQMFHLSAWQRFWKIEVPHAVPGLVWNAMVSMSAGWFFVVAAEAIAVSNQKITLPGIGSYIHLAIEQSNLQAIAYAAFALLFIIFLYDQLFFRPLLAWSEKFLVDADPYRINHSSWLYDILNKTLWIKNKISPKISGFKDYFIHNLFKGLFNNFEKLQFNSAFKFRFKIPHREVLLYSLLALGLSYWIFHWLNIFYRDHKDYLNFVPEIYLVLELGAITCIKVIILVLLASVLWVPIGVWIGFRPQWAKIALPLAQFLAAFPANLLWPLFFFLIAKHGLSIDIFSSPLMIIGNQWYILFNVISGTLMIPKELKTACESFKIKGFLAWRKLILPAIFPSYITGAMAAAGGCWNAAIVADVLTWGDQTLVAKGLGAYIVSNTNAGDFPRIVLGLSVMCLYVVIMNRLIWQKCYNLAAERFSIDRYS
ncbi:MAG: ABC transporter permease [Gammaproteobacteria bacterium]